MSDAPSLDQAEGPNPFSLSSSRKEGDPGAVQVQVTLFNVS